MSKRLLFGSSTDRVPTDSSVVSHVCVIMDGNGRWAKRRGMGRINGHRRGVEAVRQLVRSCVRKNVPYLTLFAFSSENWRRPSKEVSFLLDLLNHALENEVKKLHENNVRLRVIGDLSRFSQKIRELVDKAQELTRANKRLNLTIAVNYGGRWDITQATQSIAEEVRQGSLAVTNIDSTLLESRLSTADLPEPDLFIRTGGEKRISNFLLWQLAYTELYFTRTLWPDFDESEFDKALSSFSNRQRRFGRTGDQVESEKPKIQNA